MSIENLQTENLDMLVEVGLHKSWMPNRDGYYSGVRPNHWMPGRDYCFIGQLDFLNTNLLKPGESYEAVGKFIVVSIDVPEFKPGFCWHICEASTIVGYCRVIEVKYS